MFWLFLVFIFGIVAAIGIVAIIAFGKREKTIEQRANLLQEISSLQQELHNLEMKRIQLKVFNIPQR